MGVERLPEIVDELVAHGRSSTTPVAVIEQGTLAEQRVFTGTLRDIITRAKDAQAPATIVVGNVVNIRADIQANTARHALLSNSFELERETSDDEPSDFAAWRRISELAGR
jgi:precorrin-4 methylase